MTRLLPTLGLMLLAAAALMAPRVAAADTYQVDLIVFTQDDAAGEAPLPLQLADVHDALDPADTGALHAAGIEMLNDADSQLNRIWAALGRIHRYRRLAQLSWLQTDPPEGRGPVLHVSTPATVQTGAGPVHELDGTVSLHGGFYLHVDTDLIWTVPASGDAPAATWRLDENRRVRLNEVHYLDGARLGAITRVTKIKR
jgi:hypothetical protein